MSIFTKFENAEHSFAAWAEKELGKLSTEVPSIEKVIDPILQYVGGASAILAGIEGGPAASAAITKLVSTVQTGVTAVGGLVQDFGATPTVASIASALAANTSSLLAAAKVTNPTSVATATSIVTNLNLAAQALSAAAPAPVTTVA
jgi:hypothetical protein